VGGGLAFNKIKLTGAGGIKALLAAGLANKAMDVNAAKA